ncbi:dehydrogenase, E1 component subunits alpha and beta, partial [Candidatus Thiomargarita nelsonii]
VHTYRLAPHSKGDDNRDAEEIKSYREKDPINLFAATHENVYKEVLDTINRNIARIIEEIEEEELKIEDYLATLNKPADAVDWKKYKPSGERCVTLLNQFFHEAMADGNTVFIGEDVLSPYGGAFKVAKGLSDKFPARVFSTPISEAAITGIGNGLALSGIKTYVEIMFGDFVTLAMDQIINHASKFYYMYN